jgi:D-serine deaminase-like pyridoxal phosphate-dependent protein
LTQNIEVMEQAADAAGTKLRPHAKSHKSARIARMQFDAGATGICVARLSEAEALVAALEADGGPPVSVLITSSLGNSRSAHRAAALADRCDFSVMVDHVDGVTELAGAAVGGRP